MHPDLMRAIAIDRQHYILDGADPAPRRRDQLRPARPQNAKRRSPIPHRVSAAFRHPAL